MAAKLKRLVIDRVDLVDKGANPDAHIILFKRDDSSDDDLTPLLNTFIDKAGRVIAGARLERLKQAVQTLQRICDEAEPEPQPKPMPMKHDSLTLDKGAHDMAELEELTKRATDAEAQVASLQAQIVTLDKRATDAEAEVVKLQPTDQWQGVSVELRKRIEAGEERVAKAETEVRKRDCIGQVKKYTMLPVNPDDHWEMFDKLNGLPEDIRKQVYTLLDSAQEVARQSGLFTAQGNNGSGDNAGSAYAQMDTAARELLAKGAVKTVEQGIDRVMQEQPALYARYEAERRGA